MKNNIFGFLFFVFIVIIMGFAIYKVNSNKKDENGTTTDNASVVDMKQKGTSLTLAISNFDTINPIITKNKNVQDITKLIYEPLVNITEDGRAEPCLAKEWETTDNKTYIIKLRTGVKWTDGTFFSSSDVQYTIDKLLRSDEAKDAVYLENVKYLQEVDIIDNTTIRIILSKEIPFYEYYLNFPILSSHYYGNDNFWNTDKNDAPITTGKFYISETNGNSIILTKNENWWNKENDDSIINKITINFYSTVAELYNAFKLGGIDLISTKNSNFEQYIGKIGYNVNEIEGRQFSFIALNTQNGILSDVNVRRAIRAAINKNEIASNEYKGTYFTANFPLAKNSYLVDDSNDNYFNLGSMEKYLNESGWRLRSKIWQKTINYKTTRLDLNLVVRADSNRIGVAEYIKNTLAQQGIIIDIIVASKENYNNYLKNKNYDMILTEITNSISPDLSTYFADRNLANFNNSEAKEIINDVKNITSEDELKNKYQRLYEIYDDQVPYIGIGRNKIYVITNSYLNGDIKSQWYNLFFNIKNWYTT